jgi:hypothetical protein
MDNVLTTSGVEADLKKIAKVGRGKRDLILIAAFVGVAGLIAWIAGGFRGSDVSRGAEAMTAPVPPPAWHVPTPPTSP